MALPKHARVVVIGGGAVGTSIAYHLTKLGWSDVVLLERGRVTSGTTWHAAGLFMQLRTTHTMTELCRYGAELFPRIHAETGLDTGFKRSGSLPIARTRERLHEIARLVSLGKVFGVEAHMVSPEEAKKLYPLLDPSTIVGGAFIPGDGQINPVDLTGAFVKGARMGGAKVIEGVEVTGFKIDKGRVTGVTTGQGDITCERAVVACGLWTRTLAATAGVNVPLYASEHMYVTTDEHPDIPRTLPVIRDTDGYNYIKEDAGKLLVGAFEPNGKSLPLSALPKHQEFIELPEDWDQFELPMSKAMETVPLLNGLGIRHFMNGPESFTPDNRFIVGEAPNVDGLFVAAGFNSQGILASPGVGKAVAEWVVEGSATMDLSEMDISRFNGFETNEKFLKTRISESLGLLYEMHWPHRQFETARPVRQTALYERLAMQRACFGTAAGIERANWFAREGQLPTYEYSYGRQNWFENVREEHEAARNAVAMFDLSSFGKTFIEGRDACRELQRLTTADVDRPVGSVIYTQMLNERGGIESDLTFTRLGEYKYLMVTAAAQQARDMNWVRRHLTGDSYVSLTDVSAAYGTLSVTGPNARRLMERVSEADFSNDAFPFRTAREISIGYGKALALRISFVGELGWEIYPSSDFVGPIFDALVEAGREFGLRLAGYHALDTLRSEKGFVHWGHDVSPADTPIEAGLGFIVSKRKSEFIGADIVRRQQLEGVQRRLIHIRLATPEGMMFHDEPIYRDNAIVGRVTSGAFGYTIGSSVGSGYITVPTAGWTDFVNSGNYEVEIAGQRHKAIAACKPFYDPEFKRPKQ